MKNDANTNDMSNGMLRQRRNFMGISIFVPFYLTSGLEVKKITILGNEALVKNPQVLTYSLAVIFLYFAIRYYQYFLEEKNVIKFKINIENSKRNRSRVFLEKK